MNSIYIVGIVVVLIIAASLGILFLIPKTKPFAKKYWWIFLGIALTVLGTLLLVRKPGQKKDTTGMIDEKIANARIKAKAVEVETKLKQKEAEEDYRKIKTELDEINKVDDPFEKHKKLCDLYNRM